MNRRAHLADPKLFKDFYEAQSLESRYSLVPTSEPRMAWVLDHIGDSDDVLDIGCDKGGMTVQMWAATEGRVAGVDIAEFSIRTNQHAPQFRDSGIEWVCSPAERLPFPDDTFDVAVLAEILEHVADPAVCVAEAERVVRSGGRVVITVPKEAERMEQEGTGADDIKRTGYELDGHVRDYLPEEALAGKPGLQVSDGKVEWAGPVPFEWRLAAFEVRK